MGHILKMTKPVADYGRSCVVGAKHYWKTTSRDKKRKDVYDTAMLIAAVTAALTGLF